MSTTRVTDAMLSRNVLADLNDVSARLASTQRVMSSGKRISQPSDDPYGTTQAIDLRSELSGVQQYESNIQDAQSWQQVTDSALGSISDAVQRVRELVVGAANDAGGQDARNAAASEIDQLVESIKTAANSTYAGRYVFAGTATTTKPYTVGGPDTYAGNTAGIARQLGPGVSVTVNVDLSSVLGSGQSAADGKLLDTLRTISADLRTGTPA